MPDGEETHTPSAAGRVKHAAETVTREVVSPHLADLTFSQLLRRLGLGVRPLAVAGHPGPTL